MKNNSLAITIGDYNGVGPKCVELALRKLNLKKTKIFVIGDYEIFDKLNFPKCKTYNYSVTKKRNCTRLLLIIRFASTQNK